MTSRPKTTTFADLDRSVDIPCLASGTLKNVDSGHNPRLCLVCASSVPRLWTDIEFLSKVLGEGGGSPLRPLPLLTQESVDPAPVLFVSLCPRFSSAQGGVVQGRRPPLQTGQPSLQGGGGVGADGAQGAAGRRRDLSVRRSKLGRRGGGSHTCAGLQ